MAVQSDLCVCKHSRCVCHSGYKAQGKNCYEIDPCLENNRGGCDKNVSVCHVISLLKYRDHCFLRAFDNQFTIHHAVMQHQNPTISILQKSLLRANMYF